MRTKNDVNTEEERMKRKFYKIYIDRKDGRRVGS